MTSWPHGLTAHDLNGDHPKCHLQRRLHINLSYLAYIDLVQKLYVLGDFITQIFWFLFYLNKYFKCALLSRKYSVNFLKILYVISRSEDLRTPHSVFQMLATFCNSLITLDIDAIPLQFYSTSSNTYKLIVASCNSSQNYAIQCNTCITIQSLRCKSSLSSYILTGAVSTDWICLRMVFMDRVYWDHVMLDFKWTETCN